MRRSLFTVTVFIVCFALLPASIRGEDTLFERTLTSDVETADRQELMDWAGSLGLSTRGTRRQVEDRILEHYGVQRRIPDPEEERDGVSMRIERARGSRFFDIEQADERNLRLVGGVRLTVEDEGVIHTIEAEEILINTEQNTLAARGGVIYVVRRADGEERFRGDEIVFRIETWEGVFIRGITETRDRIEDEDIDFFVEGRRISRSGEEIIVVEGGTITSSTAEPPNWRIRANRIWILAPGEWGLRHAVLYVGRVPTLYLPFFFLPGDRLFFHPVAGTRTREGTFIQTTTYFFGKREDEEPPISIMRIAESPDESERVIQGLFLRIPEEPREPRRPDWTLKFMADVYTTLGGYSGVAGSMPNLGPLSTFDWRLGLGVSRNIYFENDQYSNFYVEEGVAKQHWNSGFFLGTPVPYRYESETRGRARFQSLTLTWNFLLLSDPEFRRDFHDRSERMDWAFLLSPSDVEEDRSGASVTSLNWEAGLNWNPSVRPFNPWITSLSVSQFRTQVAWRTRQDQRDDPDWAAAVLRPESDKSPELTFFFPQSVVLPELQMRMAGTFWQYPSLPGTTGDDTSSRPEGREENDDDEPIPLRPPWEGRPVEEEEDEDSLFRLPERVRDLPGIRDPDSGRITFGYNLQPSLRNDRFTDNQEWMTGADVDLAWRYSTFQTRNRGQLVLDMRARDRLAVASSTLSVDHRYQALDITADLGDQERERLELDTFRFRGFTANQASQATLFPLRRVDPLEESSLRYSISSLVYENRFVELDEAGDPRYESRWGEWNEDDITGHQTRAQVLWSLWSATQSLTATSDLPPRDRTYLGELRLVTGPLTTTLSGGYREVDDEWKPDNVVQTHLLQFYEGKLRAEQRLEYDVEEEQLLQARSALRVWPLSMSLLGQRTEGYDFDSSRGWVLNENEQFRWTRYTVGLAGERSLQRWYRRVDLTLQGELALDVDLLRYSNTGMIFEYGFSLEVYRFLTFDLTARSRNDFMYQYVRPLADEFGRTHRNFFEDLVNGLNLFDRDTREDSLFKMDSLQFSAIHDLQDWELKITYSGRPELNSTGPQERYEWRSLLAFVLRWRPISELRRSVQVDQDGTIEFID